MIKSILRKFKSKDIESKENPVSEQPKYTPAMKLDLEHEIVFIGGDETVTNEDLDFLGDALYNGEKIKAPEVYKRPRGRQQYSRSRVKRTATKSKKVSVDTKVKNIRRYNLRFLKNYIRKNKINLKDLSKKLNMNLTTMKGKLNGTGVMYHRDIVKFSRVLNLSKEDIFKFFFEDWNDSE